SGSMENTLLVGDRVLVNKLVYEVRDPHRGDIIVFRGTGSWSPEQRPQRSSGVLAAVSRGAGRLVGLTDPGEKDFIKRIIGLPGDAVGCCDSTGRFIVNGEGLQEPYIFENNPLEQRSFGPIIVPDGRIFVMGDHRGRSKDSRAYLDDGTSGTIPLRNVIGRAFVTVWPASRWGALPATRAFADVPPPAGAGDRTGRSNPAEQTDPPLVASQRAPLLLTVVAVHRWRRRSRRLPR
ncbi:MAG: signal peptidase I, partial [Mycobacteriales bacterium]